ncbi:MAG: VanZ family protein [Fibrobacteria bacterium]
MPIRPLNLESSTRVLALASVTLGILMVTLFPAHAGVFRPESGKRMLSASVFLANVRLMEPIDIAQNILLFIPFGVLLPTFIPARRSRCFRFASALGAGMGLSAGVELIQTWLPGRFPSAADILLNGLGAGCGALLSFGFARLWSALQTDGIDAALLPEALQPTAREAASTKPPVND